MKRRRTIVGVNDVTGLVVSFSDPFGEFEGVGDGGGEEDVVDFVRKENDGFFPDYSTFCGNGEGRRRLVNAFRRRRSTGKERCVWEVERTLVPHVVNLVVDDPGDFSHDFGSSVEHGSENLKRERSFESELELRTREGKQRARSPQWS